MSQVDKPDDFDDLDAEDEGNEVVLPSDKAVLDKLFGGHASDSDGAGDDGASDSAHDDPKDSTVTDDAAGDDWDAELLAEANAHGISAARAKSFGAPDNLRDYLTVRTLAAQYLPGEKPDPAKQAKDEFQEFKFEIQDADLQDSELAKQLKALTDHSNKTLRAINDRLKSETERREKLEAAHAQQVEAEAAKAEAALAMKFVRSVEGLKDYSWLFGQDLKAAMKKGGDEGNRIRKLARHYRIAALAAREAGEELPDIGEAVSELVPVVFRKEIAERSKKYERARDNGRFVSAPPNGQASREKGTRGGRLRDIFAEFETAKPSIAGGNDDI